eukprot:m.561905 g.561905  ORF g.561905 m.561905 type:complete len:85 (+) comp57796_c0_seq58:1927-2181(+)
MSKLAVHARSVLARVKSSKSPSRQPKRDREQLSRWSASGYLMVLPKLQSVLSCENLMAVTSKRKAGFSRGVEKSIVFELFQYKK